MASTTKATRAAGATLGMGCLPDIEYWKWSFGRCDAHLRGHRIVCQVLIIFDVSEPTITKLPDVGTSVTAGAEADRALGVFVDLTEGSSAAATNPELVGLPPWIVAMEATIFTGWINSSWVSEVARVHRAGAKARLRQAIRGVNGISGNSETESRAGLCQRPSVRHQVASRWRGPGRST
jgi:hypothetical protein